MTNPAAKVFISHSHVDRAEATDLHRVLEKYHAETYVDQDRIQAADILPERIRYGIEWCNAFLLLWSVNAARSDWVNREWNMAHGLRKKIIPYCLDSTALPPLLEDLVYLDRRDQQVANAGLLRAVLGRSFAPSSTELFPGTWRVTLSIPPLGTATYELELRANGQITGTGKVDPGGMFGGLVAAEGMAGFLNMKLRVTGSWEYEEHAEILTLNLIVDGLGRRSEETIQIQTTGRERGEISGQDFAGRDFVIRRVTPVRETRAALQELREAYARFLAADFDPDTLKQEIEEVVAAFEAARPYMPAVQPAGVRPQKGSSFAEALRNLAADESKLAAGAVVAKGVVGAAMKKLDERLKNLSSQG